MEMFEHLLHLVIEWAILGFEFTGVAIMIFAGIKNLVNYMRRDHLVPLMLGKGIAMGLEFLLVGEILNTVIAHGMTEIASVACIVVIRVVLTVLIHWEVKEETLEIEHEAEKHAH